MIKNVSPFIKLLPIRVLLVSLVSLSCQNKEKITLEQYYIGGKELYDKHCANCHQKNGAGLGMLYPPIVSSDFLKNKDQVICLIRYGKKGEMVVNGKKFVQGMPANNQLEALDIAEIATYIYNEWGNENHITPTDSVSKILQNCK